ncbi:imelysin family protein [Rhodohalobacter sp. 8-1]|uniref:imelysin family protein n=1 Tax=Rhodohalobacter sp. 8-1 TaxID=3131972 RepID=UPI0030EE65FE
MKKLLLLSLTLFIVWSCSDSSTSGLNEDNFDREAILVNWADNIIVPSLENFALEAESLHTAANEFSSNPSQQTLTTLRDTWLESYTAWQHVSMFEMGPAMDLRYRDNLNIYPTDTEEIIDNIEEGTYNLELPSLNNSQGFPALDYLLFGLDDSDDAILGFYTTHENAAAYKTYITDLSKRIDSLTESVLEDWNSGYRDEFVSNTGSGANSSLDMMVNDYIFYYEKILRAGKIGIPAGVFSGTPLETHVEGYYSEVYSKTLFLESLRASQNFFNGRHFEAETTGESLHSYLEYLNTTKNGSSLANLINSQFEEVRMEAQSLSGNLSTQVETNNTEMLLTYDALQQNVVYMKVDMLQALNINVDYVDADGD